MENKDEITEDGVEEAFDVSIKIYIVHSSSISCDLAQQITGACFFSGCWWNRRCCEDWFMGWGLFYLYKFRCIKIAFFLPNFMYIYIYTLYIWPYTITFSFVVNRLNYYVGGEIVTIAHLDGYVSNLNPAWNNSGSKERCSSKTKLWPVISCFGRYLDHPQKTGG